MADPTFQQVQEFMSLFQGLNTAFGTGEGKWVKRAPEPSDYMRHLRGEGPGIGIAPLRPDSTVVFAAIDLDEPDFEAAREMQKFLPGTTFLERSRSGNAHVWVFFDSPVEAWVPMGILKEATHAVGKPHVEVFPKNYDFSKVKFGNYINLPYHGDDRPILHDLEQMAGARYALTEFLESAQATLNSPEEWRKRAAWLMIEAPGERGEGRAFGESPTLHICAEHIIEGRDERPVLEGHRNAVYFALAKMLTNWREIDSQEALDFMVLVNDASPDRVPLSELRRILGNAERGEYTSFGCDDPLVVSYSSPDCPIANPRR
jgi:hypothetical protein